MKKNMLKNVLVIAAMTLITSTFIMGCGKSDVQSKASYLEKGVYYNYAKDAENPEKTYFYVFKEDGHGVTEDAAVGAGVPFDYEQEDGKVKFRFGGAEEDWDTFEVTSENRGVITGHFDDGPEMVFEPVPGTDPDTFDGASFISEQGNSAE